MRISRARLRAASCDVRVAGSFGGGSGGNRGGRDDGGGISASVNARERQHKSIPLMFCVGQRCEAEQRRCAEMCHSTLVWSCCFRAGLPRIINGNRALYECGREDDTRVAGKPLGMDRLLGENRGREWRAQGGASPSNFINKVSQPALSLSRAHSGEMLRIRPYSKYLNFRVGNPRGALF